VLQQPLNPLSAIPLRVSGKPQRVNPTPSWGGTCVGDYLARPTPLLNPESLPSSMPSSMFSITLIIADEEEESEDEEAAYAWAIEASMKDARFREHLKAMQRKQAEATEELRRIPGVVDVPTGTTRGPSLLGAAPGECGSPAKAELVNNGSTEQGEDAKAKRRKLGTLAQEQAVGHKRKPINLDDLALDRRRVHRRRHAIGDDLVLDRRRLHADQTLADRQRISKARRTITNVRVSEAAIVVYPDCVKRRRKDYHQVGTGHPPADQNVSEPLSERGAACFAVEVSVSDAPT